MTLRTHAGDLSFFEGVPPDELATLLDGLERRTYAAGTVVLAEGDRTKEVYIPQSGAAEVVISDSDGSEHRVGRVAPGGTVGEISLLTGQPAVATVRATADLDVVVLTEEDFTRIASAFPQIYRNVGTILAERLARTDRLVVGRQEAHLTMLENRGAPPLLGYALACSIAWHTRERTLLVVLGDDPPAELKSLASTASKPPWRSGRGHENGADLIVAPASGSFAPDALLATLEALFGLFQYVLVEAPPGELQQLHSSRLVRLEDAGSPPESNPDRPLTIRGFAETTVLARPDMDRLVRVPPLSDDDQSALATGLLPSGTAAGRAIGWAARDLTGLKVGLALGAGSIRGYAHVGVIDVLHRAGLDFDYITGTSVGAAVAGLLALGYDATKIADTLDEFSPNLVRFTLPIRSLMSDRGMRTYLRNMAPDTRMEDLPVPLALIAADIESQRELVLRRGLLWQAVLASIAIPGIYPAQRIGPHLAVDGGVLNPVPVNVAAGMGAGTVIAVKLVSVAAHPHHDFEVVPARGHGPLAVGVLLRSIELMQSGIGIEPTDATQITILPKLDTGQVKLKNMTKGRRYVADGVKAAEAAMPRISAALPWLRK